MAITQIIRCSIEASKVDRNLFYKAPKSGKIYFNFSVLLKDEKGKYGDDGMIIQNSGDPNVKGEILGNARIVERNGQQQQQQQAAPQAKKASNGWDEPVDDIPF